MIYIPEMIIKNAGNTDKVYEIVGKLYDDIVIVGDEYTFEQAEKDLEELGETEVIEFLKTLE